MYKHVFNNLFTIAVHYFTSMITMFVSTQYVAIVRCLFIIFEFNDTHIKMKDIGNTR